MVGPVPQPGEGEQAVVHGVEGAIEDGGGGEEKLNYVQDGGADGGVLRERELGSHGGNDDRFI